MKKIIRNTLNDARITSLVENNFYLMIKPESVKCDTYITYNILNHKGKQFANDKRLLDEYLIQFDIYSKGNYESVQLALEEVLLENDFIFVSDFEIYEDETKLFSYKARYRYYKNKN